MEFINEAVRLRKLGKEALAIQRRWDVENEVSRLMRGDSQVTHMYCNCMSTTQIRFLCAIGQDIEEAYD